MSYLSYFFCGKAWKETDVPMEILQWRRDKTPPGSSGFRLAESTFIVLPDELVVEPVGKPL